MNGGREATLNVSKFHHPSTGSGQAPIMKCTKVGEGGESDDTCR